MKKKSGRMQSVAGIAKNREQNAARILGQKRKHLEEQNAKLEELLGYREEYAKKFHLTGVNGLTARQLNEYRIFLEKLNMAIIQQRERIQQASDDCELFKLSWMKTRTHSKAMDKVVEKHKEGERKAQDKKEQHDLDERAMQMHIGKRDD